MGVKSKIESVRLIESRLLIDEEDPRKRVNKDSKRKEEEEGEKRREEERKGEKDRTDI
jgi:hypothetical protein